MPQEEKKPQGKKELPPIVREIPDPPVPNQAHTEMKKPTKEENK